MTITAESRDSQS